MVQYPRAIQTTVSGSVQLRADDNGNYFLDFEEHGGLLVGRPISVQDGGKHDVIWLSSIIRDTGTALAVTSKYLDALEYAGFFHHQVRLHGIVGTCLLPAGPAEDLLALGRYRPCSVREIHESFIYSTDQLRDGFDGVVKEVVERLAWGMAWSEDGLGDMVGNQLRKEGIGP